MQISILLVSSLLPFVYARDCDVQGYAVAITPYFASTDGSLNSQEACALRCLRDEDCQSYGLGRGNCWLYSKDVSAYISRNAGSPFRFFDRACPILPAATFTSTSLARPRTTSKATTTSRKATSTRKVMTTKKRTTTIRKARTTREKPSTTARKPTKTTKKQTTTTRKATTTKKPPKTTTPAACSITNGFTNGDFDGSGSWTYTQPTCPQIDWTSLGSTGPFADSNTNDGWALLLNFYIDEVLYTRETKPLDPVTSSFETDVKLCPGAEHALSFRWRRARGAMSCSLTLAFGDKDVFTIDQEQWVTTDEWNDSGPILVPGFLPGQSGVRQVFSDTTRDMYVRFRGEIVCRPVQGFGQAFPTYYFERFWTTFLVDAFEVVPWK